jgi:hypothetical protein
MAVNANTLPPLIFFLTYEAVPKLQFLEQLLTPEKIAKAVTA